MTNLWIAFGLTLLAGMATGLGSVISFVTERSNYRFLSVATGFSAGVMLYVSFVEILGKASEALIAAYGDYWGNWVKAAAFFAGILLIGLVDNFIPEAENPHEPHTATVGTPAPMYCPLPPAETEIPAANPDSNVHQGRLLRTGLLTALAIAIHNFPEGLVTFLATLRDPTLGVAIAIAIALHNFPEGISVCVPVYYATGNQKKAFCYSALSGFTEPLGAAIAYVTLRFLVGGKSGVIPERIMGMLFAGIAGIMVYISLDELLPTSRAYGKGHDSLLGLLAGMLLMALSLLLMQPVPA
jgi:ZIP family zinc transporter